MHNGGLAEPVTLPDSRLGLLWDLIPQDTEFLTGSPGEDS